MRLFPLLFVALLAALACAGPDTNDDDDDDDPFGPDDTDLDTDDTDDTDDTGDTDDTDDTAPIGPEGSEDGDCSDERDNDHDGAIDCEDEGCLGSPACDLDNDRDGYTPADGDCDDTNATINPAAIERTCSGVDEDCDISTPDDTDADGDAYGECTDCDDTDASSHPGAAEICADAADQDCDGDVDEGCSYTDTWVFDDAVAYTCAMGLIDISFGSAAILDASPDIEVQVDTLTLEGPFTTSRAFTAEQQNTGSCTETYSMTGEFVSYEELDATFTITWTGSCFDCTNQSWALTGSR